MRALYAAPRMEATMVETRIGTVDLPDRIDRERYFRELTYLELSALFAGPLKPGAMTRWSDVAPEEAIGLVAPWVLTHRTPPEANVLWPHDASVGDFRDSAPGRAALTQLHAAAAQLHASWVIFRSPPLFAPSAANRETLRRFFGELATEEAVGAPRVWIPDGLWQPRSAITFATELGITCALDPLVRSPGEPPEIYFDLEVTSLYLRVEGLGRSGALRHERQEDLAMLLEHYEDIPATIAFASPERWQDARNLRKLLKSQNDDEPSTDEEDADD